jgi:hypothetical protein
VKFLLLAPGEDPDALFRDRGLAAYEALRAQALKPVSKTKKTSHHQGFDPDGP